VNVTQVILSDVIEYCELDVGTVLNFSKLKQQLEPNRKRTGSVSNLAKFKTVADSLDSGELL